MTGSSDLGTSSNLPVSLSLPGYRLRRLIGEDAIGLLFDAVQESLERRVTVKVLRPEYEASERAREEFLAEMDRLVALAHPNLLRVIHTEREAPLVLVTESAAGSTLADLLSEEKPLGEERSLDYARSLARALAYLGSKGFAHKNVTPSQMKVLEEGGVRLFTFRNVILAADQAALKGKLAQDPLYVAPEQIGGDAPIGEKTPVYQIAALLFHMLAGHPPYGPGEPAELARAHYRAEFPSIKRYQPFIAKGIFDLLAACSQKDPDARPDLAQLDEAFGALVRGKEPKTITPPQKPISAPVSRRRRRRRYR